MRFYETCELRSPHRPPCHQAMFPNACLGQVRERPDDVNASSGDITSRQRFELALVTHVEQQRLQRVVAMMAKRQFVAPQSLCLSGVVTCVKT